VIDGKRRQRIARGSGASVEQVNQLLEARKTMEKMMKQMGRGKMPALSTPGVTDAAHPAMSRRASARRKKRAGRR
jgi:signal recognition particle subunit SRP54